MAATTKMQTESSKKKGAAFRTIDLAYMALAVAMLAVCSWICIPATISFTMQTFAVFLIVCLLGGRRGTLSVVVYLLLGAVGAPVFAEMSGGIGCLLGPTGGYLIGFVFSALVMWAFERFLGKKLWMYAVSMVLALIVCYAFGTAWFMHVYVGEDGSRAGLVTALSWCVFPYLLPDLAKIALALLIGSNKTLRKVVRNGASA